MNTHASWAISGAFLGLVCLTGLAEVQPGDRINARNFIHGDIRSAHAALENSRSCAAARPGLAMSFAMLAGQPWFRPGIFVCAGQTVMITASGSIYAGAISIGQRDLSDYETPDGDPRTSAAAQTGRAGPFAAPGLVPWSLVGRIGAGGTPFAIGSGPTTIVAPVSGELLLSVNDNWFKDDSGAWQVRVSTATVLRP